MNNYIRKFVLIVLTATTFFSCKENAKEDAADDMMENETEIEEINNERDVGFSEFDSNKDNYWDRDEFNNSNSEMNKKWDTDADGTYNNEEFYATTMGKTDLDRDKRISQDEWKEGRSKMFGDYAEEIDFETWDSNGDNFIDDDEWNTGFINSEWFTLYDVDKDGTINVSEWNEGSFNDWDRNNDGMLDENEYSAYKRYSEKDL